MKVLVTGGAGFIGNNLVKALIKEGIEAIVIDNFSSGRMENLKRWKEKIKIYKVDIRDRSKLEEIFRKEKPEVVYHLAAQVNVVKSVEDPVDDASINVLGTINLLDLAAKTGVEKFIYASSGGAVYGEPKYLPVDEHHSIEPISPYGLSKFVGEEYIRLYHKLYDLPYMILRYSNVYGPGQSGEMESGVIAIFISRMLKKERPIIFGDGFQTRDFIFIDDVTKANILSMEKNIKAGIFNIGSGKETSVIEIFELLRDILRLEIEPIYSNPREGEVRRIYLNIEKAKNILGWKPKVSLDEGLKRTIRWFKERRGG
ncbi:MAG TPA: SDR family oxidoreductase [Candidatus Altiarchaeales archaeon]|nr:SDR family oxidoreductase [Candidatus Altiarchaeales archaeon]